MTMTVILIIAAVYTVVFLRAIVASLAFKELKRVLYNSYLQQLNLDKALLLKVTNWTVRESNLEKHLRQLEREGIAKRIIFGNWPNIERYWRGTGLK